MPAANTPLPELERRALELVKQGDFGPEATRVNAAITEQAPQNVSAWTRLGRCHLEQRRWDDAVLALRTALALTPSHTIAINLLNEVRKQRARTPTVAERSTTGFGPREFEMLASLPAAEACAALRPRIETLFDALNSTSTATLIVEARQSQGESGAKLFHANSYHADSVGHILAFHHGGRFEPQCGLGWFSNPPFPASCVRIGLGFHFSTGGREPDRLAGKERALIFFERFQQTLERSWKRELARWMGVSAGFIQYGDHPPARNLLPEQAVEWLLNCRNAAALEWVFVGRWLFLDNPDDARILGDRAKLAKVADDTFRTLYPLWLSAFRGTAGA